MKWVSEKVQAKPMRACRELGASLGQAVLVDAKAEGNLVVVAGWETFLDDNTKTARRFSLTLDERTAPWAFWKGEPFKMIASLDS